MPLYNPPGAAGGGDNRVAAGTQTGASTGTVVFSNSNNVTFGMSNSSIVTASVTVQSTQGSIGVSAGAAANTVSALTFSNSNGVSFGLNAGTVTASHNGLTSQSNQAASGQNGSFTFQTLSFGNSNGISFGSSGSSITASHNALTTARASNDAIGLNTAQSNVTWTVNSSGLSFDARGYAGTGTSATNASITLNSNGLAVSVAAPGAAAENNWVHLTGNTAGNTTVSGSTVVFSGGNNITVSGTNGSVIVFSAGAGGGAATQSGWDPWQQAARLPAQIGQGSVKIDPVRLEQPVQFDRIVLPLNNTNSSNSSGSHTLSFWFGFYTRNANTLSLLSSTSSSTAVTHSGTAGSYSLYSGFRIFTIPMTTTLTTGDYWLALLSRTTSGGANGSYSNWVITHIGTNFNGHFGSSHATTAQLTLGLGHYTATTSAMPGSIAFTEIQASGSLAQIRQHLVSFASGTE